MQQLGAAGLSGAQQSQGYRQPPTLMCDPAPTPHLCAAANEAVAGCLRAAEAASVALRLAELQLEQWSHAGEASLGSPAAGAEPAAGPDHAPSVEPAASETPSGAAPEAAAGVPKRKRAGRTAPAASATSGGDAPTPSGGGGAAARAAAAAAAAAGGKGLRHFSLKVCEKVEEKGDTTYEEVANDLIADLAAEVAAGALPAMWGCGKGRARSLLPRHGMRVAWWLHGVRQLTPMPACLL